MFKRTRIFRLNTGLIKIVWFIRLISGLKFQNGNKSYNFYIYYLNYCMTKLRRLFPFFRLIAGLSSVALPLNCFN